MMFLLRIELIKWHFLWDTDKEQLYWIILPNGFHALFFLGGGGPTEELGAALVFFFFILKLERCRSIGLPFSLSVLHLSVVFSTFLFLLALFFLPFLFSFRPPRDANVFLDRLSLTSRHLATNLQSPKVKKNDGTKKKQWRKQKSFPESSDEWWIGWRRHTGRKKREKNKRPKTKNERVPEFQRERERSTPTWSPID